jgi:alkanesulfonate monooxygenase SsuD/methylene tetrahydromethanopterin reductase-like flavin-dependent oxidoreductase (luciferase family)
MPLDLSVIILPDADPWTVFLDEALAAEAAGVRTVWTYDHLSWKDLRDGPWHATVPLLTAAAMRTSTVRLGTQVASPNFRHPVPFAKEIVTLDHVSGGRLDLGVGAGGVGADATALGGAVLPLGRRAHRFEEWVALLDAVLTQPVTTVEGTWFSAHDARQIPGCAQSPRVPMTVAAAGPRALRVAARYGQAWVTYGSFAGTDGAEAWFAELAVQAARLDALLDEAGRERTELRRIAQVPLDVIWPVESPARYRDFLARLAALGFDEVTLHWPRKDGRGLPRTALDAVLEAHALGT